MSIFRLCLLGSLAGFTLAPQEAAVFIGRLQADSSVGFKLVTGAVSRPIQCVDIDLKVFAGAFVRVEGSLSNGTIQCDWLERWHAPTERIKSSVLMKATGFRGYVTTMRCGGGPRRKLAECVSSDGRRNQLYLYCATPSDCRGRGGMIELDVSSATKFFSLESLAGKLVLVSGIYDGYRVVADRIEGWE